MSGSRRKPGRLGPFVEGYRESLLAAGYTSETVRGMLKDLGRLGRWMESEGVEIGSVDVASIESFLAGWRADGGRRVPTVRALRSMLTYLREVGVMVADEAPVLGPLDVLLGEYPVSHCACLAGRRARSPGSRRRGRVAVPVGRVQSCVSRVSEGKGRGVAVAVAVPPRPWSDSEVVGAVDPGSRGLARNGGPSDDAPIRH
jgi:hypothetical protein